jgi:2-polyprenyl-3-methyl-5-hydroxy-6-metoxy-1,4-benzoquinol methylase
VHNTSPFIEITCPLCGDCKEKRMYHDKVWGGGDNENFLHCLFCDVVFLHPFPLKEKLKYFYENQFGTYMIERSVEMEWNNLEEQYKKLSSREIPLRKPFFDKYLCKGSVCDIGSSTGFTLDYLNKKGFQTFGIEPSKEHALFASKAGNKIFSSFDEIDFKFDNVIHYYVLEHVLDPINFLKDSLKILKSKGHFIFEIPNRNDALYALFNNAPYKNFIMQKMHLFYYSVKSIRFILDQLPVDYKLLKGERYGLDNHLNWQMYGEPGALKIAISKKTNNSYKEFLLDKDFNDHFIIVGVKN